MIGSIRNFLNGFARQHKLASFLELAIGGFGCYLVGRWFVTWIKQGPRTTQKSDEVGRREIGKRSPKQLEEGASKVKSKGKITQTKLADKNRQLGEQIQETKIPNFQSEKMMERMIEALMQKTVAHCIFENIFLGGQDSDVANEQNGFQLSIAYLLSASIHFKNERILSHNHLIRHIIGRDMSVVQEEDIDRTEVCNLDNLNAAFQLIDQARRENKGVLIHCQQGKDRSATVVAAYLVSRCRVSANQAYGFIRSLRMIADTADPYIEWVKDNEKQLQDLYAVDQ